MRVGGAHSYAFYEPARKATDDDGRAGEAGSNRTNDERGGIGQR